MTNISTNRKMPTFRGIFTIAIAATLPAGCASGWKPGPGFPVVVGASGKSGIQPCADYASYLNYSGRPYYVQVPGTGDVISRHKGMDFCTNAGTEVIASANGTIVNLVRDNAYRGGRVTIKTMTHYVESKNGRKSPLFLDALHITPKKDLERGDEVKAGQVIGYTQPPGKVEIGSRSHVHLSAGPIYQTWIAHTDPNRFWQKGPGIVSCFDSNNPPGDKEVVAPIKC